jgi:hypothetical protein
MLHRMDSADHVTTLLLLVSEVTRPAERWRSPSFFDLYTYLAKGFGLTWPPISHFFAWSREKVTNNCLMSSSTMSKMRYMWSTCSQPRVGGRVRTSRVLRSSLYPFHATIIYLHRSEMPRRICLPGEVVAPRKRRTGPPLTIYCIPVVERLFL